MDNAYSYDAVSNVLGIQNNAPLPQSGKAGGRMSHSYTYDPLYRLASATGTYAGANSKTASYTLAMGYDNMHRITSKKQHLSQSGVQFEGTLNAGYDLTYTYGKEAGKKFRLDNVRDINYRTEETPTDSTNINNGHKYEYDLNGNLVYINTSRVKKDSKEDDKASEQKYRWDEENRLLAADENGFVSNYWYDADGERTAKTSGENEAIYVNSEFSGGNTGTARFSLYVSPYLVAGQGGKYTKHIYVGSQRIVSKLGDLASYGADPRRIPYAGNEADGLTINYKDKYNQQLQSIKDNYKTFDLPYNGEDNDDYVNGQGFCCNDGAPEAAQAKAMTRAASGNFKPNDEYEKMQFYYHPDHLGSSSYITNLDGEVSQHIEYVPFGEVFIEERNNTWNTPYLFNAKELDEETGMYYYGARYYEPRLSLWMSVDPFVITDDFYSNDIKRNINGGIYNFLNSNVYAQSWQNPIRHKDDDGNAITPETAWDIINVVMGAGSFVGNVAGGNVLGAVLDGIGLIYDGVATAVPVLPAGASSAIGAYRFMRAAKNVVGSVSKLGKLKIFKDNQRILKLIGKAENAISDHLNLSDVAGAVQDILGIPVRNGNKVYSHISEVSDAMKSLTNLKSELKTTLKKGGLTSAENKQINKTLKEIDSHLNRINKILNKAHEIAE